MLPRTALSRQLKQHAAAELYYEADGDGTCVAIYSLSDPRSLRDIRYIGQSSDPRQRFLQHLNSARLWIPDELPWWIKSPKLRPLYEWIRQLYREHHRLPTMIVRDWAEDSKWALLMERAHVCDCLSRRHSLLNVESKLSGDQLLLL